MIGGNKNFPSVRQDIEPPQVAFKVVNGKDPRSQIAESLTVGGYGALVVYYTPDGKFFETPFNK